ncbi:MAG: prepilin-type N-terminal cleavage/methylation domain-containing protein [bacterium]
MGKNKGFTLIELVMIIVILGILSVVAIPRYLNMQSEAKEAAAKGYIGALNSALTIHVADHYLRGTAWVADGAALMNLLESGSSMPSGMSYAANVWSVDDEETWQFVAATDTSPPLITDYVEPPPEG